MPDPILSVLPNGSLTCNGVVVGRVDSELDALNGELRDGQTARIFLDLGWCAAAGLGVTVLGDRAVDKGRKPLVDR